MIFRILFILCLMLCPSSAQIVQFSGASVSSSVVTPTLIQHVASSSNPVGIGITGNNFKFNLPNAVRSGDCLILGITYPHGSTPTVTDTNGNTWPSSPSVSADAGVGGYVAAIFVLPNANSGVTQITVSFGSTIIPFQYTISEFNNIATVSAVNGTASAASDAGASISTGSFTPGNNNSNGGNIIWAYYAPDSGTSQNPSSWVAGSGFSLLDADIAWTNNQGVPHASQYQLQTTSAAINPTITATGDTNGFNAVAVALKASSAGGAIPAGIHINKLIHQSVNITPGTWTLQFPTTGNLRVMTYYSPNVSVITNVVDSESGSWTKINLSVDEPQFWYRANVTANSSLSVTLTFSGSPPTSSVRFYDIQGAATSPVGASAGSPLQSVSNQTTISNHPSITPQASNSLIIARGDIGNGPGLSVTSPTGAIFDLVTYTGEADVDLMENADLEAHYYNPNTSAINFNWTLTAIANNSSSATAVEFKAP